MASRKFIKKVNTCKRVRFSGGFEFWIFQADIQPCLLGSWNIKAARSVVFSDLITIKLLITAR